MIRNAPYCYLSHTREGFRFESITEDKTERQELQKMLSDLLAISPPSRDGSEKMILTMCGQTAYLVLQKPPGEGRKESRCTCDLDCYRLEPPPKEMRLDEKQEAVCGEFVRRLLLQDPAPDVMAPDLETAAYVYAVLVSLLPPLSLLEHRLTCCFVSGQPDPPALPVTLEQLRLLAGLLEDCQLSQEAISQSVLLSSALTEISRDASPAKILSSCEPVGFLYQHLDCIDKIDRKFTIYGKFLCAAAGYQVKTPAFDAEELLLYYMNLDLCPLEQAARAENILRQRQHIIGDNMYAQVKAFLTEPKHSVEWIIRAAFLNQVLSLSGDLLAQVKHSQNLCEILLTALYNNTDRPAVSFLRDKWNIGTKKIETSLAARMFFLGLMKENSYHQFFDMRASALQEVVKLLTLGWKPGPELRKKRTYRQAVRCQLRGELRRSINKSLGLIHQLARSYWG